MFVCVCRLDGSCGCFMYGKACLLLQFMHGNKPCWLSLYPRDEKTCFSVYLASWTKHLRKCRVYDPPGTPADLMHAHIIDGSGPLLLVLLLNILPIYGKAGPLSWDFSLLPLFWFVWLMLTKPRSKLKPTAKLMWAVIQCMLLLPMIWGTSPSSLKRQLITRKNDKGILANSIISYHYCVLVLYDRV